MKFNKILFSVFCFTGLIHVSAQDIGQIEVKDRIDKSSGFFLDFGISDNIIFQDDYSSGINFNLGFHKKKNRALAIGLTFGFSSFKLDEDFFGKTPNDDLIAELAQSAGNSVNEGNFFIASNLNSFRIVQITGGDLTQLRLGGLLKLYFIPISDDTKFTVSGNANPFLLINSRAAVSGSDDLYNVVGGEAQFSGTFEWDSSSDVLSGLASNTQASFGLNLSIAFEYNPAQQISFYLQAGVGYTFPIEYVDTSSYLRNVELDYFDPDFPLTDNFGFSVYAFNLGVAYNY